MDGVKLAAIKPNMLCAELDEQLARSHESAPHAFSLPPAMYVDEGVATLEIDRIWRREWICLGRSEQCAKPGDFATFDFAGQAVILLRDHDYTLKAYANSCRHRGARLLDGTGRTSGIRCSFHSWAYKLDGSLAGAPHMNDVDGFCREDFGLIRYRCAERLGFAFVCLAEATSDIDSALGNFPVLHANWPLESLVSKRRQTFEVDCNWKAFIEVFNEYYHLPFVHPDSIDDVYHMPDPADDVTGSFATQFGSTDGTGGLLQTTQDRPLPSMPGLQGRAAAGVRYSWLFPNMTFAAGSDALWMYEAYPLGANRCNVIQTACFPAETVALPDFDVLVAAYYHRLDAALAEDIPALVNQQRGMMVPDARQGRFQPLLESNVASFARWYAGRMLNPA